MLCFTSSSACREPRLVIDTNCAWEHSDEKREQGRGEGDERIVGGSWNLAVCGAWTSTCQYCPRVACHYACRGRSLQLPSSVPPTTSNLYHPLPSPDQRHLPPKRVRRTRTAHRGVKYLVTTTEGKTFLLIAQGMLSPLLAPPPLHPRKGWDSFGGISIIVCKFIWWR